MIVLKKEIFRFLIAGLFAVATDLIVYLLLLNILPTSFSKFISYFTGTFVSYLINKYWTFERNKASKPEISKFIVLYSLTLLLNVGFNHLILILTLNKFLAFIIATGVSTMTNFIGQKWWVFR